jgi:hypothetical protein
MTMTIKKLIPTLIILTTIFNISCDKESINPIDEEIEQFKVETTIQFQGKVFDNDIYWKFDNWDNGIGAYSESFWCVAENKAIQQRNFAIYDYELRENLTLLKVISPALDTTDLYSVKKAIFEVGLKQFQSAENSIYDGFIIEGTTKIGCFSTYYGSQDKSSIEIIKIQELSPDFPEQTDYKKIRLWTVITCDLYECGGQKVGTIEKGRFISEIEIERN